MTLDEVRREIDRLNAIKRELEKEEREEHKRKARQFVGKCYKRDDGAFCKIVSIPLEIWTMYSTSYNEYQFPALFLQFPEGINERNYKHDNIDEFIPCYCDTIYFDIKNEFPGDMLHGHVFEEITPEEFNTEFDKCIESFKEQFGMHQSAPMANKHTCEYVYRTFEDLDGPQYWCKLYNKDCDNCRKDE